MRSADNIIITLLQQIAASGGGGGGGGAGTNGAITGGSITVNTSGVSINLPAYLTTAALSQNTSNYAGINGAITGGSITVNTSGVSVNLPAYLTTAAQSGATSNYAGINGAITGGSITVNTSGVSVNLPAYLTTADLSQNSSKYAGINGAITGGSITVNTSGVSVNLPAYLTTAALSQNTSNYAGINSAITGGSMTVNTSGISVNIANVPQTLSFYENVVGGANGATIPAISGSTYRVFPFVLPNYISASYIRFFGSPSLTSTSLGTSAVPTSTTFSNTHALNAVIYSQGVGASSRSLQYVTSASAGWTWQLSVTAANATNNWTVTANMTWPSEGANTANTSWNSASTLSTINISTTDATYSQFGNGNKYADIPFAASLSPGNYWMAINEANGTVGGQAIAFNLGAIFGHSDLNSQFGAFNSAANSSNQFILGLGGWSTNSIGATTSSIALANISTLASHFRPYFQFIRQA